MQPLFIFTALLLVASISAEHAQEVSNVQSVPSSVQVDQPAHVGSHHQAAAVESGPASQAVFGAPHQPYHGHHHQYASSPGYEPAGMMYTVGGPGQFGAHQQHQHQSGVSDSAQFKPVFSTVGHYAAAAAAPAAAPAGPASSQAEQYGQPESASVPPNYKPFGSWGLYIGGNPADGYYTNFYKALSNSVADKQQAGEAGSAAVAPASGRGGSAHQQQAFVSGGAPATPSLRQGPFYPAPNQAVSSFPDQTYQGYPYTDYYTPADLNSGSRVQVQSGPSSYSSGSMSPASYFGGVPAVDEPAMYFAAEHYSKKSPSSSSSSFSQKEVQVPSSPAKGYYQQRAYQTYQQHAVAAPQQAAGVATFSAAPAGAQVVAYPVPVGSQMVGSQPGVEGAFAPYGVHAFTRYAVKPTVVSTEQTTYYGVHSAPAGHFPVYKQQYYGYPQPLGFYGFPLSQLHYSSNAASSAFAPASPAQGAATVAGAAHQPVPVSPAAAAVAAAAVHQQQQQQQQHQHPAVPEPQAPVQAPVVSQAAPVPPPAPVQAGPEPAGPVPVMPVDAPVVPFEAASSEKSETSQSKKQATEPEQRSKVESQQQQQKSN